MSSREQIPDEPDNRRFARLRREVGRSFAFAGLWMLGGPLPINETWPTEHDEARRRSARYPAHNPTDRSPRIAASLRWTELDRLDSDWLQAQPVTGGEVWQEFKSLPPPPRDIVQGS